MIVRTLNENFTGNKFAAYMDGYEGVFVCRLLDAATMYVADTDEHNIINWLDEAEEAGPEAIDAVCSALSGEWQLPAQSQRVPSCRLLVFHA